MRIVRHQAFIAERKKRARLFAILGFLLLSGSLFMAWYPNMLLLAYVFMLTGFILFNMGMQQIGKWTRNPRNDQILDHRMAGLSDRVTLVHYAQVGKSRIEHMAIHPGGVAVLTAREIDGRIQKRGNRWTKKGGIFRRMFSFSGPQLGNPSFETEQGVKQVEAWLDQQGVATDVQGAIVFLHPKADLDIQDPDYPVLLADEVDLFLSDLPADETFQTDARERVIAELAAGEEFETAQAKNQGTRRPRPVKRVAAPKTRAKAKA
jgi:hypothetical protein